MKKDELKALLAQAKGMSDEEADRLFAEKVKLANASPEFADQMLASIKEEVSEVSQRVAEATGKEAEWLSLPWVNASEVCRLLYGNKDNSTVAYFTLKRQGKRPWKQEELSRLTQIRDAFMSQLSQ
jgi:hypothetical protein